MIVPGYETLGDDPNLPVLRRTRTIHVSDALTIDRGRHHLKDRRRVPRLSIGRLQPSVLARPDDVLGRVHGPAVRRLPARLSDGDAARGQRQPPGAAHVVRRGIRAGRLATHAAAHVNAGVRYEFFEPPYDTDNRMAILNLSTLAAAAGRPGRRLAIRPEPGSEQLRPARRRELRPDRQRTVAASAAATASSTTRAR